jgi:ABC-type branched-subunit amino acid transport system ATPase component
MTPLVAIANLCKSFPGVPALHNLRLEITAGEVHAPTAKNGAGKPTLMKILATLRRFLSLGFILKPAAIQEPEPSSITISKGLQGYKTAAFSSNTRQKLLAFASLLGLLIFFNVASPGFMQLASAQALHYQASSKPQAGNPS